MKGLNPNARGPSAPRLNQSSGASSSSSHGVGNLASTATASAASPVMASRAPAKRASPTVPDSDPDTQRTVYPGRAVRWNGRLPYRSTPRRCSKLRPRGCDV
jgi:hypothetical protein